MAEPDQNDKMDSLLRSYAKRPQAPVELHPASRRALHDEVKTVFGTKTAEHLPGKRRFWPAWWIRWPIAAGFAAWAVVLVLNNRRFEDGQALSRKEARWLAEDKTRDSKHAPEIAAAAAPPAPSAPPVMSPMPQSAAPPSGAGQTFGLASMARARSPANPAYQQLFQNAAPSQQVLNNFQVERQGGEVLVTDGDGSVYTGSVVAAPQSKARVSDQLQPQPPEYSFAVQGMNRSIQQAVYFNGSVANSNPTNTVAVSSQNAANQAQMRGQNQRQSQAARVTGTVTIGATNQYRLEATAPAGP